jgi:hypothetical protein
MKNICLLVIALSLSINSHAQYAIDKHPLVVQFKEKLLEESRDGKAQSKSYSLPILRERDQTVILVLHFSGTDRYVNLFKKSDYEENKDKPEMLEILRKRTDVKSMPDGQSPMLNLTSLADGEYIIICHTDISYPNINLTLSTK